MSKMLLCRRICRKYYYVKSSIKDTIMLKYLLHILLGRSICQRYYYVEVYVKDNDISKYMSKILL